MKTLYIGDIHITEKDIPEIETIVEEIVKIKADKVVQLGDLYDKNRPTPKELKFGTELAMVLQDNYKEVVIMSGNGQHEFLNGVSIVEYLKYLGIKVVVDNYVFDNILCGHFMTNKSMLDYGSHKYTLTQLKKYKYVFLGHQHSSQTLNAKTFHVGSIRYQHWNEVRDTHKHVALLDDDKLSFIKLKSPIKMIDIVPGDCGLWYLEDQLPKLDPKTKVRVIISKFAQLKNCIDYLKKQKNKFHEFTLKLDFEKASSVEVTVEKKDTKLKDILQKGIENIKDKDVKKLLQEQFKEI